TGVSRSTRQAPHHGDDEGREEAQHPRAAPSTAQPVVFLPGPVLLVGQVNLGPVVNRRPPARDGTAPRSLTATWFAGTPGGAYFRSSNHPPGAQRPTNAAVRTTQVATGAFRIAGRMAGCLASNDGMYQPCRSSAV